MTFTDQLPHIATESDLKLPPHLPPCHTPTGAGGDKGS